MCIALFHEYSLSSDLQNGFLCFGNGIHKQPTQRIHWFEFCQTYLLEKIVNPNPDKPNRGVKERILKFYWESNLYWEKRQYLNENGFQNGNYFSHPIDYLYEEFVKLNKTKG